MDAADWLSSGFIAGGLFFFVAGTIGLLRLPDPLSRLHALTKADNLGLLLIILGLLVRNPETFLSLKLGLLWLLVLAAGATGAHLIAKRAAHADEEDTR